MMTFVNWSSIGCVCFDVDSTVCVDEGLDEIAKFVGAEDEVKLITLKAMNGELDFSKALEMRLQCINLTVDKLNKFLAVTPPRLTPGIKELIFQLKLNGVHVCLVSGGLYPLVIRIANILDIPAENVFANKIIFTEEGLYDGFDRTQPTSLTNGKAIITQQLIDRFETSVMIVGDGMTDANACPPAEVFIGFGVNINRDCVRKRTKYFCNTIEELVDLLKNKNIIKP